MIEKNLGTRMLAMEKSHGSMKSQFLNVTDAQKLLHKSLSKSRQAPKGLIPIGRDFSILEMKKFRNTSTITLNAINESLGVAGITETPNTHRESTGVVQHVQHVRKERHDNILENYNVKLSQLSEELENEVISVSRKLRDILLETIDSKIDSILSISVNKKALEAFSHVDVLQIQLEINSLLHKRCGHIEAYIQFLEDIERRRCNHGQLLLTKFVRSLVDVGYLLQPEISRLVEEKVEEINLVVVGNIHAFGDISARLRRLQVEQTVRRRSKWAEIEKIWKELKHSLAVEACKKLLCSESYTNPSQRRNIFHEYKLGQKKRHEARVLLLNRVKNIASTADQLDLNQLDDILKELHILHDADDCSRQEVMNTLNQDRLRNHNAAKMEAEKLRYNLQTYASLVRRRPPLQDHFARWKPFLSNGKLEEFYRKAGSLKASMKAISFRIESGCKGLMYSKHLIALESEMHILSGALNIETLLEKEGKSDLLKSAREVAERMRTAGREDLQKLCTRFVKHIDRIRLVKALPPPITQELENAISVLSTYSKSTSANKDDKSLHITGLSPQDVALIRRNQKRVTALLYASKFPKDIKHEIALICQSIEMQKILNIRVDAVINAECKHLIYIRDVEYSKLCSQVKSFLQNQADAIASSDATFVKFVYAAGGLYLRHRFCLKAIDANVKHRLAKGGDENDDRIQSLNNQILQSLKKTRQAEDEQSLQAGIAEVTQLLNRTEKLYHTYFINMKNITGNHQKMLSKENLIHFDGLCDLFRLCSQEMADSHDSKFKNHESIAVSLFHPAFSGSRPATDESLKAITPLSGNLEPLDEKICHPLKIVFPDVQPVLFNADRSHPSLYGYRVFPSTAHTLNGAKGTRSSLNIGPQNFLCDSKAMNLLLSIYFGISQEEASFKYDGKEWLSMMEFIGQRPPVDQSGSLCVECFTLPIQYYEDIISTLRNMLFERFHEECVRRKEWCEALGDKRVKFYTAEIEERLRLHWPRKGRAEVECFQPRVGELQNHKRRLARHIRSIKLKCSKHEENFQIELSQGFEKAQLFSERIRALSEMLNLQTTIAGLQGVLMRGKETTRMFVEEFSAIKSRFQTFCVEYPDYLRLLNKKFIEGSMTFQNGGEYADKEVAICKTKIERLQNSLDEVASKRKQELEKIENKEQNALHEFETLQSVYDEALQDLSMREGLGKKYGAPRRNAQEKNRYLFTMFENSSREVHESIMKLQTFRHPGRSRDKDTHRQSVGDDLVTALLVLQRKLYKLGHALNVFYNHETIGAPSRLPIGGEDIDLDVTHDGFTELLPSNFDEELAKIEIACIDETKRLYEAEGKTAALDSDGMTERLRLWLRKMKRQAADFKENISMQFKIQVSEAFNTLSEGSCFVFAFDSYCYQSCNNFRHQYSEILDDFQASTRDLHLQRIDNEKSRRPGLGSENYSSELRDLCEKEDQRSMFETDLIKRTQEKLLSNLQSCGDSFYTGLIFRTKLYIRILDSIPLPTDLMIVHDDDIVTTKRKSLKRLRRQVVRKELHGMKAAESVQGRGKTVTWPAVSKHRICIRSILNREETLTLSGQNTSNILNQGSTDNEDLTSLRTHAHSWVIKSRDSSLKHFESAFRSATEACCKQFEQKQRRCKKFKLDWERSIVQLKTSAQL